MKTSKRIIFMCICAMLVLTVPGAVLAHSGRTDSSGGHHDYKNKSGLGSYHYHHGLSAHLHNGGVCPYNSTTNSASSQSQDSQPSNSQSNVPPASKATVKQTDKITVNEYNATMNIGEEQSLDYEITYAGDVEEPTISSSNSEVISVEGKELVAKKAGTATITIKTSTAKKSFTITSREVFATDLEISTTSDKVQKGETIKLMSVITPSYTTDKEITYTSSDKTVATVSYGGRNI